jgi:hypothetical protein
MRNIRVNQFMNAPRRRETTAGYPLIAYERGFRECQFPMPTCGFLVRYPVAPINTNPTFYRWRGSGEVNPLMASETGAKGLATAEEESAEQSCETFPEPSISVSTVTGTVMRGEAR